MLDNAAAWLQGLKARGVTITVKNNRLRVHPAKAHGELSDDEALFLRHNREAIKAAVVGRPPLAEEEGYSAPAVAEPTPTPVAEPSYCRLCNRAPCVGPEHPWFAEVHPDDPRVIEARQKKATQEMMKQLGKPSPWLT